MDTGDTFVAPFTQTRESESIKRKYRKGAVGALMDEYERAASELRGLIDRLYHRASMKRRPTKQTPADAFEAVRTMGLGLPDVEATTKYD
jgi:hypothetical protein